MASTSIQCYTFSSLTPLRRPSPSHRSFTPILCGPRDNRGPLVKGRILSTEAIQAIQSLKRAQKRSSASRPSTVDTYSPSLSRLIKSDLMAVLRELLRQDQSALALHVLSTVRSEYPPLDLGLVADVVAALARNGLLEEIDGFIGEMEGIECDDEKALVRLIKGLIGARRKESTIRICGLMKRSGVGSDRRVGEYVVKVLAGGLRRFGEESLASEVEMVFGGLETSRAGLEN